MLILWICFSIESESDESFADSISALGIFNKLNASHIFPSSAAGCYWLKKQQIYTHSSQCL